MTKIMRVYYNTLRCGRKWKKHVVPPPGTCSWLMCTLLVCLVSCSIYCLLLHD